MYHFLDIFFKVFHTLWILFNLFGWIWDKTRFLNFIAIALTGFSWGVLGIWYGFGYCPCTEWHWEVRRKLGFDNMPNSYVKYLIDELTGLELSAQFVNWLTLICFLLAAAISVYVNFFRQEG